MDYLEEYKIRIKTLGAIFVGSGEKLNKTDYIIQRDKVLIPNINKMYKWIIENDKIDSYEESKIKRQTLKDWIDENSLGNTYQDWIDYFVNMDRDDIQEFRDLNLFIKDIYNCPYIPGSSLKGVLRTIILYGLISEEYQEEGKILIRELRNVKYAKKVDKRKLQNALNLSEKRLNSIMKGIRITDSKPLEISDLFIGKKIDLKTDKASRGNDNLNRLPIFREYLKPGVEIELTLTLDKSIQEIKDRIISIEKIENYIEEYYNIYDEVALTTFGIEEEPNSNIIYLGGGAGFFTKTLEYSLLIEEAIEVVSKIIHKDSKKGINNHLRDKERAGISPRVLKLTEYDMGFYEIGKCKINFSRKD